MKKIILITIVIILSISTVYGSYQIKDCVRPDPEGGCQKYRVTQVPTVPEVNNAVASLNKKIEKVEKSIDNNLPELKKLLKDIKEDLKKEIMVELKEEFLEVCECKKK